MKPALQLIEWWRKNGRDFPWRRERDPYKVLVAEMLLHRTRAQNVVPVYIRFVNSFGSAREIAGARDEDIKKVLKPLGLNWRAEKLIETLRLIARDFHGNIPIEKAALLKLPGIGDYISSAFRTFYGGNSDPLIDTNTVRVLCRLKGETVRDSIRRGKNIRVLYSNLLDHSDSREFGYALIDLASEICRPSNPLCNTCPVLDQCSTGMLMD